jgi:hypothetical protein
VAYSESRFGYSNVIYNLGAETLLTPKSALLVSAESTANTLRITQTPSASAPTDVTTMVAVGQFSYRGAKATLADVSGTMTEIVTYRNGELIKQITFGAAFDVSKMGTSSQAEALTQQAYRLNFYAGNDRFVGSTAGWQADQVMGLSGDDIFYGYAGNDYFDGGSGLDTVVLVGRRVEYTIKQANAIVDLSANANGKTLTGYTVQDKVGLRDDTDTLIGIERLQFSDKTLALDTAGNAGMAYRLYKAAFNRIPDTTGLGYWITKLDRGMDLIEVSARFVDSTEFRSLVGSNPTNAQFLTEVYSNVLQRDPDAAGYAWWLGQMSSNPSKTQQKVLADFSESPENKGNVADLIGAGILFEPPTI